MAENSGTARSIVRRTLSLAPLGHLGRFAHNSHPVHCNKEPVQQGVLQIPWTSRMNEQQFNRSAALLAQNWTRLAPDACFPLELHQKVTPLGPVAFHQACSVPITLLCPASASSHVYDISVAYNHSYRSPVLFIRGFSSSNILLTLDDMACDFPCWQTDVTLLLPSDNGSFISPEIHPGYPTSAPWFAIHPCQTQQFMSLLGQKLDSSSDDCSILGYLIAWLRVLGPWIGLRMPVQ